MLLMFGGAMSLLASVEINVKTFGARGDGKTDDTAAIQKAADAAVKAQRNIFDNRSLYFPAGTYRLNGQITLRNISLRGTDAVIAQKDKNAISFYYTDFWSVRVTGLTFNGGKGHVSVINDNTDKSLFFVDNCRFFHCSGSALTTRHGAQSVLFTVKNCEFRDMNTNGILMVGMAARVCISGCYFEDIGMSAVSIGDPIRVGQHPRVCSYDVRVENNFLRRIGFDFPSAPALDIFRVDGLSVCHNTIEYCAYSGISVGWEWGLQPYALGEMINIRDGEIAYNRILHHMQILNDGGAIYVVGSNSRKEYQRYFNFMHDNFAYRDEPRRTVRGYYLDGSSTNWHVYDNVTSGAQRPVFAQFVVPEQYTWNNLLDDTYTTDEVHIENHAPERNTVLGNVFFAPTLAELFEAHPKAKKIYDASGCR